MNREGILKVEDGTIVLADPQGNRLRGLTASEVFRAAVRGHRSLDDGSSISSPPAETCPGVAFERVPATIRLVLDLEDDERSDPALMIRLDAGIRDKEWTLADEEWPIGDQFVRDGVWFPTQSEDLSATEELLRQAGAHLGANSIDVYPKLVRSNSRTVVQDEVDPMQLATAVARLRATPGLRFAGTLRPYQAEGFNWLALCDRASAGCILADEMGLGKTVQLIAMVASEVRSAPVLVVCPATILENWRREISKFAPSLSVLVHSGPHRTGLPKELAGRDVVISSYETIVRDYSLFTMVAWDVLILDEAQNVKNPDTLRARSVRSLARRLAIAVTGTPVENRLLDLWSLIEIVLPGYLGSRAVFEEEWEGRPLDLEPLVRPVILRRTVDQVARDLPPRIEIPQALAMKPDEAEAYQQLLTNIRNNDGLNTLWAGLMKLRMFCTHPTLITEQSTGDPTADSAKYARLVEIIDEIVASGEKCLIFTSFQRMVDLVSVDIPERLSVPVFALDGRTPIAERLPLIDAFSAVNGAAALVLNPAAGGVGLNITAANHVIHYNLEWNPAKEDQATARAFRIGQSRPVTVHRLFYANTVEEVIDERLQRKREVADRVIQISADKEDEIVDLMRALSVSPLRLEG